MEFQFLSFEVSVNNYMTDEPAGGSKNGVSRAFKNEGFVSVINITIYGKPNSNDDESKKIEIGFMYCTLFDIEKAFEKGADLSEIFESHSPEAAILFESLTDKSEDLFNDEHAGFGKNILLIDFLYIKKEYRNKEIGSKILDLIGDVVNYSVNDNVGCIAAVPAALDKHRKNDYLYEIVNDPELNDQIRSFFINAGYRPVPNSDFVFINMTNETKNFKMM